MKNVWVAAFSLTLLGSAAFAAPHKERVAKETCASESSWRAGVKQVANDIGGAPLAITGDDAIKMMKAYNSLAVDVTGIVKAEEILVLVQKETTMFMFIHNGVGCGRPKTTSTGNFFAWLHLTYPEGIPSKEPETTPEAAPAVPHSTDPSYAPHEEGV